MNVLDTIVKVKRGEVERAKARLPPELLKELSEATPHPRPFEDALRGRGPKIIAEVKRASPSRGVLRPGPSTDWRPDDLALAYENGGASALSVLTDVHFFWGHPDALGACRARVALPALRKDFIVDPYQVDESRWLGADAVLLIARCLDLYTMQACNHRAQELGMAVLAEIHADTELDDVLTLPGAIIGINHRNLDTMTLDMERTERLRDRIPLERIVVAESGLGSFTDLQRLMEHGVHAFLVGEHLASTEDPRGALETLRGAV